MNESQIQHLKTQVVWSLRVSAYALNVPNDFRYWTEDEFLDAYRKGECGPIGHAYDALKAATMAGTLAFTRGDGADTFMRRRVRPVDLIAWAENVGIPVSPDLVALAARAAQAAPGVQPEPDKLLAPENAPEVVKFSNEKKVAGLETRILAECFADVFDWPAARWLKNLSAAMWAEPARVARGEQGGASALWNPLMLAQLLHGRNADMKLIRTRFKSMPPLAPWKDAFEEYFQTHCAAD